jgi:hypothetical protein
MHGASGSHRKNDTAIERIASLVLTAAKQYGVMERASNKLSKNITTCTTLRNTNTDLYSATITIS